MQQLCTLATTDSTTSASKRWKGLTSCESKASSWSARRCHFNNSTFCVISRIASQRHAAPPHASCGWDSQGKCSARLTFQPLFSVIYLQGNMERVVETYDLMSEKYFTHASPTMFNAGKTHQASALPTATCFDMMVTCLSQELPAPSFPPVSSSRWRGTASRASL
jgi:hypothetical protein